MRWLRYFAVAVVVLVASWFVAMRGIPAWRARAVRPVMDAYLRAAAAQDSTALAELTTSNSPVHWALTLDREVPEFIAAARRAHPEWVLRQEDTLAVSFRLARAIPDPTCVFRPLDDIQARFVKGTDGKWRIARAAVDVC